MALVGPAGIPVQETLPRATKPPIPVRNVAMAFHVSTMANFAMARKIAAMALVGPAGIPAQETLPRATKPPIPVRNVAMAFHVSTMANFAMAPKIAAMALVGPAGIPARVRPLFVTKSTILVTLMNNVPLPMKVRIVRGAVAPMHRRAITTVA
jgi:hypothetical protein